MPEQEAERDQTTWAGPAQPQQPVKRSTGRGHVSSYGEGRTCAVAGCNTRLSRYNGNHVCAAHDGATHP